MEALDPGAYEDASVLQQDSVVDLQATAQVSRDVLQFASRHGLSSPSLARRLQRALTAAITRLHYRYQRYHVEGAYRLHFCLPAERCVVDEADKGSNPRAMDLLFA